MGPGAPVIWHTAPMADTGRPTAPTTPSLEMPSFSLRRKKKEPEEVASDPAPADARSPPSTVELAQPVRRADPSSRHAVVPWSSPTPTTHRRVHGATPPPRAPDVALSGLPAAAATGVVVGGLAVLLAWLATSACDAVRGTSSCGGGPGLLILVAVLVVLAYAGSLLLRLFGVPDAGSTSILAVGILAVLVMVFLLGSIDEWWAVIAIPVAAVIATAPRGGSPTPSSATEADVDEDVAEPHDVR